MTQPQTESQKSRPAVGQKNPIPITPFFIVADLRASIEHYIERFGFQLEFQGPADDVYYAQVRRDGIAIMLKTILPDVLPAPTTPGTTGLVGTPTSTRWIRTTFRGIRAARRLVREGAFLHP